MATSTTGQQTTSDIRNGFPQKQHARRIERPGFKENEQQK